MSHEIEDLGRAPFAEVHAQMLALRVAVLGGASPGRVLLVEHEPVYTAGRATPTEQIRGDIVPIERGGKITYHGPGQLVVYPILTLPRRDIRDWLHRLEDLGVAVCRAFGLDGEPSVDGTGVFVARRKVASIGVAVKRWVNLHGIAINVDMDLAPWHAIEPCGRSPEIMTDLTRAAGRTVTMDEVRAAVRASVFLLTQAQGPARTRSEP